MIDLNDVLLAMSNIPVDDPIAEIWGRQMQGGYKIIKYTGSLPITIRANGDALIDYRIYGAYGGVGEQTDSGEPAGYKLPMTVYKQEFVVTGDMLDQSNWVLSPPSLPNPSYFIYFDISDLISKEECVAKIYENFSAGYTPEKLVVALTDDMYTLVATEYRILNNYGVISNKEFDFSSWDKIYLCIGYGNGFRYDAIKQSKIDELFENWKILIAHTSQTREAPVYIGENQLDAIGEYKDYVDKASGKIVRCIKEYTFTGEEAFPAAYGYAMRFMNPKFNDANSDSGKITCFSNFFNAIPNNTINYFNLNAPDRSIGFRRNDDEIVLKDSTKFTTAQECINYLKSQYDNGTPVKFWYVLEIPVEEDPPAPLPEIPTIDGTTIIDYDGDPKPSQMYVKYKGKG